MLLSRHVFNFYSNSTLKGYVLDLELFEELSSAIVILNFGDQISSNIATDNTYVEFLFNFYSGLLGNKNRDNDKTGTKFSFLSIT